MLYSVDRDALHLSNYVHPCHTLPGNEETRKHRLRRVPLVRPVRSDAKIRHAPSIKSPFHAATSRR
jgi:hypothetical protein